MLTDKQDAFGHMYLDYMNGTKSPYTIERDDGDVKTDMPDGYFKDYDEWSDIERKVISLVSGRVLDIGCGAGRHCLYLQQQGFDVVGIENSPLAVQVVKERGVRDARLCDIQEIGVDLGYFDTILLFGNNLSLLGTPTKAKRILRNLYRITPDKGRIIGSIRDPYNTDYPVHISYHQANKQKGKLGGQGKIKIRYQEYVTPWTDFLMLSKSELENLVEGTGWLVEKYIDDTNYPGIYFPVIQKENGK